MAIDRSDILDALGFRSRDFGDWVVPALIGFGVGALLGGGIALLFAPRAGGELRESLLGKARGVIRRGEETMHSEKSH
jgi:hypothetical protein